jgi:hypothetical protein
MYDLMVFLFYADSYTVPVTMKYQIFDMETVPDTT